MSKWQSRLQLESRNHRHLRSDRQRRRDRADHLAGTVDFGASDAPLSEEQFEEADAQGEVVQIPWALSGTVPAYNVKGGPKNLKLNGEVLSGIYLGTITSWDDPAIAKLNPGVEPAEHQDHPGLPQRRQR